MNMWMKHLQRFAGVLILVLAVIIFMPVQKADAATGLTQPEIYTNKIVMDIEPSALPSGTVTNIYVDVSVNNETYNRISELPGDTSQITISNASPKNSYDIRVYCDYISSYGSSYTDWIVGSLYDAAMAPVKVKGLKQTDWYPSSGSLYTTWTKQPAATGYQYQLYNYKNKKIRTGVISNDYTARMDFTKLATQTYKMRVRSYTAFNGSKRYGAWSTWLNVVPSVKSIKGQSAAKKKITITWSKVKGATSYTILVSTKQNSGYKVTKTVSASKTKATISKIGKAKLKSGKYYYVYVRANKKIGKKTYYSTFKNAYTYYVYGKVK